VNIKRDLIRSTVKSLWSHFSTSKKKRNACGGIHEVVAEGGYRRQGAVFRLKIYQSFFNPTNLKFETLPTLNKHQQLLTDSDLGLILV
jgi:hypothetical protein